MLFGNMVLALEVACTTQAVLALLTCRSTRALKITSRYERNDPEFAHVQRLVVSPRARAVAYCCQCFEHSTPDTFQTYKKQRLQAQAGWNDEDDADEDD